jgi:hypothetical protein
MDLGLSFYTMAENKQSFVLYADQYELFKKLPNEVAGELIKHIFAYVNDENPQSDNLIINIAFEPIKAQLKRDLKRWELKIEARSRAGKASAESKKLNKLQQESTNSTHVDFVQQTSTQSTDNVNVNVNVNDNVNEDTKESVGETSSPTPPKSSLKETLPGRERKFIDDLAPYVQTYGKEVVRKFFNYWSEKNKSGTKMKWELERTFEISKRLATWVQRDAQFNHNTKNQENEYIPKISKSEYETKYGNRPQGSDDPEA